MNTKIVRSIESAVIDSFLKAMENEKETFTSIEEVFKKMNSLKKTQFLTDDDIASLKKKKSSVSGRPKNSWMLFLKKYREDHPGNGKSGKEISQEASQKWKSMSEKDKLSFTNEAQKLMNEWKATQKKDSVSTDDEKSVETDDEKKDTKKIKSDEKIANTKSNDVKEDINWDYFGGEQTQIDYVMYSKSTTKHQWGYCMNNDNFHILIKSGKEGGKAQFQEKSFESKDMMDKYIKKETASREKKGYAKC